MNLACTIGVDIGGTKIEVAVVEPPCQIIDKVKIKTQLDRGPQGVVDDINQAITQLLQRTGKKAASCGVAIAGQVDALSENVLFAPNLKWKNVPLKALIEQSCQLEVSLLNDVRAALIGEWLFGAGKGAQDCVCLFVGTGVGGGIVSCGRILRGHANSAGELGHMVVSMEAEECSCGNRGCVEALASGWAIARQAKEMIAKDPKLGQMLLQECGGREISAEHVSRCAKLKDPLSCFIMHKAARALIAASVSIVHSFNPERLIFGGGVFFGQEDWLAYIDKEVRKQALKAATDKLQIVAAHLKESAGALGAAAAARERL